MTGRFVPPFLWTGGLFGGFMIIVEVLTGSALLVAIVVGIVQGLLFGGAMGWLNSSDWVRDWLRSKAEIDLDDGETVQVSGLATLDNKGGILYLTNQHLRFASHAFNFGARDWSVPLSVLEEARPSRTVGGLLPNGLRVDMGAGREKVLKTWEREEWCEVINDRS